MSSQETATSTDLVLSVVVPVLNEEKTLAGILDRLQAEPTPKEIIIVDDGSTDRSPEIARGFAAKASNVVVLRHEQRRGKGSALRTGFATCKGRYVTIQDADTEYDPADFIKLLHPLQTGEADVVYGSREDWWRTMGRLQRFANWCLSSTCNLFYGSALADVMTCYKLAPRRLLEQVPLESKHFEIECELTAKFLLHGWRIKEVPISYSPRTREQGKKIRWTDGLRSLWTLARFRFTYRAGSAG